MCGRFNVIDSPGLRQLLQDLGIDLQLPSRANIAPTEPVPLVRRGADGATVDAARWWLTPSWAGRVEQKYSMFNARAETLASSRAFRTPFRRQRGIVPMSSFIEWRVEAGGKQPWLVTNPQRALAAAALWDIWDGDGSQLLSCTLVTTAAAASFQPWHRRMPVFLDAAESGRWLDNRQSIAADDPLFRAELKSDWKLWPVSRALNNARDKSPELLRPAGEAVRLGASGNA